MKGSHFKVARQCHLKPMCIYFLVSKRTGEGEIEFCLVGQEKIAGYVIEGSGVQ